MLVFLVFAPLRLARRFQAAIYLPLGGSPHALRPAPTAGHDACMHAYTMHVMLTGMALGHAGRAYHGQTDRMYAQSAEGFDTTFYGMPANSLLPQPLLPLQHYQYQHHAVYYGAQPQYYYPPPPGSYYLPYWPQQVRNTTSLQAMRLSTIRYLIEVRLPLTTATCAIPLHGLQRQ